jgi:phage I-like protein
MTTRGFWGGEGVRLLDNSADPATPVWIQIAKSGSFAGHVAGPFELNTQIFNEIITNFRATQNRRICVDFEHASEQDATSGSIPTLGAPAQGWIIDLRIQASDLWGLVEWLEPARSYIRQGKYPWVSPAIRFGSRDRVTGKPIGARLSSVALTTQPFLDGMQAVAAKDTASGPQQVDDESHHERVDRILRFTDGAYTYAEASILAHRSDWWSHR